ncbi:MAG TPA: helix-turn-helix domain-containing protein [Solirubrobacteraceae bacterium]|jgi:excisionase family DNA binding protein
MSLNEPEETYLTVAEVAQTLKLNQQTVRNWIDQGSLPALRVGRRVRIKRSDFERILEESYHAGSAPPSRRVGPSADDFWGGEPVGVAEPAPGAATAAAGVGEGMAGPGADSGARGHGEGGG